METVLSGIRPTGNIHLGNYFGAISNWVKMQENYNCFFFVADYHSLTTHPKPDDMQHNVKQQLAEILACGVDPEKCTVYIQSDLPETIELYLLLNMNAYKGELERCTSFKDKIRDQQHNINAGLLTYPVLMASDILIHRAHKVPVGKDQEQHLEMTRNFAARFNNIYGQDIFPEPVPFSFEEDLVKIPGLDGSGKMGKSESGNNAIFFTDQPDVIRKKVMRAVSDTGPTEENQAKPEAIQNLFTLMNVVSAKEIFDHFNAEYNKCTIRYGDMKKQIAEDILTFTQPFRERINNIIADDAYLGKVAKMGAEKAHESGAETLGLVKKTIGIRKLY